MRVAERTQQIAPFRVMAILARARELEAGGRRVVHMEIGEPDFVSPSPVVDAGRRALAAGATHYTPAAGLTSLREAIADYYRRRLGVAVDPSRILVTPGASGALQLVLGALIDPGDRIAVTDPGYPCNRHMIGLFGGTAVAIEVDSEADFAVTPERLAAVAQPGLRALMVASPANPTGNILALDNLRTLADALRRHGDGVLVCDEIYQGLQYDGTPSTALALDRDDVVVINSFSKFFGMTGWRVGWVVAPTWMTEAMERIAQNLFLAAPTLAQHAALAAFDAATLEILEQRRQTFAARRDFLFDAIRDLGFVVATKPSGAFYLYADAAAFTDDSSTFCRDVLEASAVAITPGADFGGYRADRYVRFAYTTEIAALEEGVERLRRYLSAGG
ncbi:MAG: aminotransferase class I/II-fold pyridoxal phosphate-dependent enzyme [Gammaproteobacteria bacterium]|nr:aminotransferase class I/II-fold pyridoxal phosphate-dependent enzyme [Gammaproteobacteria bacterium]